MSKVAAEHLEMAAKAFTSCGKPVDGDVTEKFAEILAQECAGHSDLVQRYSDLRRRVFEALRIPAELLKEQKDEQREIPKTIRHFPWA